MMQCSHVSSVALCMQRSCTSGSVVTVTQHMSASTRPWCSLAQHSCVCSGQVNKLRGQPQRQWDMQTVRGLLQLTGVNMAALLERHEVMTACQQQLDMMPKPVGLALLRPVSCTPGMHWCRHARPAGCYHQGLFAHTVQIRHALSVSWIKRPYVDSIQKNTQALSLQAHAFPCNKITYVHVPDCLLSLTCMQQCLQDWMQKEKSHQVHQKMISMTLKLSRASTMMKTYGLKQLQQPSRGAMTCTREPSIERLCSFTQ